VSQTRRAAVAGQFYPASPEALERLVQECYLSPRGPGSLPQVSQNPLSSPVGLVLPHAGYYYSGPITALGMGLLAGAGVPEAVVVIGPNHRGLGPPVALSPAQRWETPFGPLLVDRELASAIVENCTSAEESELAHQEEHSVEVMTPFLRHLYGDRVPLVPVLMERQDMETSLDLGRAVAAAGKGRKIALIASTDLSHFYGQDRALELDDLAIEAILTGEPEALIRAVTKHGISMCGYGPVMAVLEACRRLGLGRPRLLGHATSGDATGDYSWVVGYAALAVE